MSMNALMVVDVLLAAEGAYMAATGKSLGGDSSIKMKYTEKSCKKYNRVQGGILLAAGAALFAVETPGLLPAAFTGAGAMLGVAGFVCVASLVAWKALLKKRGSMAVGCDCNVVYVDED